MTLHEPTVSRERFEREYAENSRVSLTELRDLGLRSAPCNCPDDDCRGWAMIHDDLYNRHMYDNGFWDKDNMYFMPPVAKEKT